MTSLTVRLKAQTTRRRKRERHGCDYDGWQIGPTHRNRGGGGRETGSGSGVKGEGEYDDEVEDGEAYDRFGSAFDRYEGIGVGSGVGTTGLGGVYGWYEARRIWEEFEGEG